MTELSEGQKAKAAFQLRRAMRGLLESVYNMHGYQDPDLTTGVVDNLVEISVQYAKVMRGIDVQIDHELAKRKLMARRKKG